MSDNTTDDAVARRSTHLPSAHAEAVPPVAPPRPPLSEPAEASPEPGEPPRRRIGRSAVALIAATVIAVAGWVAFGVALAQSAIAHDDLAAAQDEIDRLDSRMRNLETSLDSTTAERDELAANAADVTAREADVAKREAAVKKTEEYIQATTLKDGFTYTVGLTMEPGTYRANSTSGSCYWKITVSGTNYSDIVENDLGSMGIIDVIVQPGQDFMSNRCGDWTKVG